MVAAHRAGLGENPGDSVDRAIKNVLDKAPVIGEGFNDR
jgi:hypothetical protein